MLGAGVIPVLKDLLSSLVWIRSLKDEKHVSSSDGFESFVKHN